jgi:predicted  nucleic acid-binding Zn-ribbon protein
MDQLKQLETKLQAKLLALVQQRGQLQEELTQAKAAQTVQEEELHALRRRLEDLQTEHAALAKDRESMKKQVESILQMVEGLE